MNIDKMNNENPFHLESMAKSVDVLDNFHLKVFFKNGETRILDYKPHLKHPFNEKLNDPEYFAKAGIYYGVVTWPGGEDISPYVTYEESIPEADFQPA